MHSCLLTSGVPAANTQALLWGQAWQEEPMAAKSRQVGVVEHCLEWSYAMYSISQQLPLNVAAEPLLPRKVVRQRYRQKQVGGCGSLTVGMWQMGRTDLVSKTLTTAPMFLAVPMAERPATPPPMTSTLAGGTRPAAVIWPVKNRPNWFAASITALQNANWVSVACPKATSTRCHRSCSAEELPMQVDPIIHISDMPECQTGLQLRHACRMQWIKTLPCSCVESFANRQRNILRLVVRDYFQRDILSVHVSQELYAAAGCYW